MWLPVDLCLMKTGVFFIIKSESSSPCYPLLREKDPRIHEAFSNFCAFVNIAFCKRDIRRMSTYLYPIGHLL